jgi:HlyD family secretion protein
VWCLDSEGRLRPVRVVTGITDGRITEIRSPEVTEGMEVINGLAQGSTSSAGSGFVPGPGPFPGGGPPPPGGGRMF